MQQTGRLPSPATVMIAFALVESAAMGIYALNYGWPLRYGDESQYLQIASGLSAGHGFQIDGAPTAYRPPAWPVVIALLLSVGVPPQDTPLISVVLVSLSGVLAGLICVRITSSAWGWIAAPLMVLYPLNFYAGSTLYPQAFAMTLLLTVWLLISIGSENGRAGLQLSAAQALCAGLALSLCVTAVPTMGFTVAVLAAFVVFTHTRPRWKTLTLFTASFLLPIVIWIVRNMMVFGSLIPLSTTSGENLYIGNNPTATATSGYFDVSSRVAGLPDDEVARDARLRSLALTWMREHPVDALVVWFGKTLNYFSAYSEPATAGQGNFVISVISWVSLGVLVTLVVVRLALRRWLPLERHELLFVWIFVANAPVMAVFFTRTRFRQPLDSILVCEAAVALTVLLTHILYGRGRHRTMAPTVQSPDV